MLANTGSVSGTPYTSPGSLLLIAAAACLVGCGGVESRDVPTGGSGGVAGSGGTASGGGGAASGGGGVAGIGGLDGGGGNSTCPLDSNAKGLVTALVKGSIYDGQWVLTKTQGIGVGAERGYGGSIPSTEIEILGVATTAQPCGAPTSPDPTCETKVPETFQRCSQIGCESAGVLTAKVWIDPLPVTSPTLLGCCEYSGQTTVNQFEQRTRFMDLATDKLQVTWDGEVEVVLSSSQAAQRTTLGEATLTGTTLAGAKFDSEITLLAPKALGVHVTLAPGGPAGTIEYAGMMIAEISPANVLASITWIGPCGT